VGAGWSPWQHIACSLADVQRCETTPNKAEPQFWDVSHLSGRIITFRATQPGSTVTVNAQGRPATKVMLLWSLRCIELGSSRR
jgi:hypothetical protein